MNWQPIETAPKDGTLLLLMVDYDCNELAAHPLEESLVGRTVGFNNLDHDGEDQWQFAGWDWGQDCFVQGQGNPIYWMVLSEMYDASEGAG